MNNYTVTLENFKGDKLKSFTFQSRKSANKCKKAVMKVKGMINHGGHYVNYSEGLELFTNY